MSKRALEDGTAQESTRQKSAINEAAAELVCPITFALPLDPVTAEDGKVYERSAIEEWLRKHERSPVTNVPMGTRLFAAPHAKSVIRSMVKSGASVAGGQRRRPSRHRRAALIAGR